MLDFTWLIEPLNYPFMQRALLAAIVSGTVCAVLSCYLILKGWALMGDALSHAVLPGIVVAFVLGIPLALGAFASGVLCTLSIGYLKNNCRVKEDALIGLTFAGFFALGLLLFSIIKTNQHLTHILFGNLLGITQKELIQMLLISAITLIIIALKYKDFLLYCFDPIQAKIIGLSVKWLHYSFLALLALTIVASIQAVGVILVVAMIIAPGASALLLTSKFESMLIISIIISVLSSVLGTFISFYIDAATGPCIVLIQAGFFALILIFSLLQQKNRQRTACTN